MNPSVRVAVKSSAGGPLRRVWLAASEMGLFRVALNKSRGEFLSSLGGDIRIAKDDSAWVLPAARQIDEYLKGTRRSFSLRLAIDGLPPFSRAVIEELRKVPCGNTITYGELACRAGSPGASRAVGNIMAANPLPLVIPCHRVVAKSGLGGFGGGLDLKRRLLRHEGAVFLDTEPGL